MLNAYRLAFLLIGGGAWYALLSPGRISVPLLLYLVGGLVIIPSRNGPRLRRPSLGAWDRVFGRVRHIVPALSAAYVIAGGLVSLASIVIIPYSAYISWLNLLPQGFARGTVSSVVVSFALYLNCLGVCSWERPKILRGILLSSATNLALAFILFQRFWILYACVAFIALCLLPSWERGRRPTNLRFGFYSAAVFSLLSALAASGGIEGVQPRGNFLIDRFISRGTRNLLLRFMPGFPLLFGSEGYWYGDGFGEGKVGGEALLSSRPLFTLEGWSGKPYYLRTDLFERFEDGQWLKSGREAVGSLQAEEGGRVYLLDQEPGAATPGGEYEITVVDDFLSFLPLTEDAFAIEPSQRLRLERLADGLWRLDGSTPLLRSATLRTYLASETRDRGELGPEEFRRYTDLGPQDERVVELAAAFADTPLASFPNALAEFFDSGFTYTLDPDNDVEGVGFASNFLLETRSGYCVHYATGALILARLNGIPARYASGYLVVPRLRDRAEGFGEARARARAVVTGLNSHAWLELWLPEVGWTVVEVTPPIRRLYDAAEAAPVTDPAANRQLAAIAGEEFQTGPPPGAASDAPAYALPIALGAAAFALILIFGRRAFAPARRRERGAKLPPGHHRVLRRALKLSSRLGVPPPERLGWLNWERELGGRPGMPDLRPLLGELGPRLRGCLFGNAEPDDELLAGLKRLRRALSRERVEARKARGAGIPATARWKGKAG